MQTTAARFERKETQPLLVLHDQVGFQRTRDKFRECCPIRYRVIYLTEMSGIFMIVLNMFFLMTALSCLEYTQAGITPSSHHSP